MLAKERELYILSKINSQKMISVKELCRELKVSRSTIRRDLKTLEDEGKINRARGGAILHGFEETISDFNEVPVLDKVHINAEEKKIICKRAAEEIEDGDLLFIDGGTTPLQLVTYLYGKKVKVVTNSFILLSQMKGSEIETFFVGGKYCQTHEVCVGFSVIEQLNQFRFDKCFIGASGADTELGEAYTGDCEFSAVKKCVMRRSKESYLLVDDTKFQRSGFNKFGNFEDFEFIFTNRYDEKFKKYDNIVIAKQV